MLLDFRPAEENSEFSNSFGVGLPCSISNLEILTDAELRESTLQAARDEKLATERLLEHLCEVERRFMFAAWGFFSLHDYVERGLGYLGSAANERVMAARFLKKVPAVKVALTSGAHTLTSVAMIGRHVKREELSFSEASELLDRCEEKSSREIERILVERSAQVLPLPEKVRAVSPELTRITLEVDAEFMALVHRMKELRGNPGAKVSELFRAAMVEYTKKREIKTNRKKEQKEPGDITGLKSASFPVNHAENNSQNQVENLSKPSKKIRAPAPESTISISPGSGESNASKESDSSRESNSSEASTASAQLKLKIRTRYIATSERNLVRKRAMDRCEFIEPVSERRCAGRTGLQFDHYPVPFAKGGASTSENLRYTCRSHNIFHAVQTYGAKKMNAYRKS